MNIYQHKDSYEDVLTISDNGPYEATYLYADMTISGHTTDEVELDVVAVKRLRKALKKWLIANGHKAQAGGRFGEV